VGCYYDTLKDAHDGRSDGIMLKTHLYVDTRMEDDDVLSGEFDDRPYLEGGLQSTKSLYSRYRTGSS
jgi:hypothetical protein